MKQNDETQERWYMVNRDGMATLCEDQADAEKEAKDAQETWPHMGPHRAVQLSESFGAWFTAADMATAAAQGFRDGQAAELAAMRAGGEPVAEMVPYHTPSGKRVAVISRFQHLPIGTKLYTHPQRAAQDAERKLLTDEQAPAQAAPAYKDSTPELHIGDSAFESWYSTYSPAHKSDKQRARDAYTAGMGDPLVTAAPAGAVLGLPIAQEPKYTVTGAHIVNRATGEAVPYDEPVFVFRARDALGVRALEAYLALIGEREPSSEHAEAVRGRIADFQRFAASNPARMKWPDTTPQADSQPAPIDMVLHCPTCGLQHIDAPDAWRPGSDPLWDNPPHRSHLCHGCGHIWRPADVPTNGMEAVKTRGKADSPIAARAPAPSVLEDAARLERERICAAIKAEDDYCVEHGDYMLDSDDCIKIVRGEWGRPDYLVDAARKQGGA